MIMFMIMIYLYLIYICSMLMRNTYMFHLLTSDLYLSCCN